MTANMSQDIQIGDRYHSNGRVVEITGLASDAVTYELTDSAGKHPVTVTRPEFEKLENKSLEWGAAFDPNLE